MAASNDERKLVTELRAGNREAFERFLDLYQDRVFNLVHRMIGVHEAEDVAQDALVEICRSIQTFRGDSALSTWVHRVAVNICLEYRRKHRPEFVSFEDDFPEQQADPKDDPGAMAVRNETRGEVNSAISELPSLHRDVVILHELQGLTYRQCAEVLGCPVGTVKSRLSKAFDKLRERLRNYASEGEVVI